MHFYSNYLKYNYKNKAQKKKIILTLSTIILSTFLNFNASATEVVIQPVTLKGLMNQYIEEQKPKVEVAEIDITEEEKAIPQYNIPLDEELQQYIYGLCEEYGIEYELFLALMHHESKFDNNVVGKNKTSTDHGLTQINSRNKKWINELADRELDITNEKDNILAGVLIYNHYKNYWKDEGYEGLELQQRALLSYNRGLNGAKKYMASRGLNAGYIKKVMESKDIILNSNN